MHDGTLGVVLPIDGRGRRPVVVMVMMMVPMRAPFLAAPVVVVSAVGKRAAADGGGGQNRGKPECGFHRIAPCVEQMFWSE